VAANVGIALGIVIGQSETIEMNKVFSQVLCEQGISREQFSGLPLLSDEASALISSAKSHRERQFFCYRHILESLGSGTLVALLA
jgi:hypothetical protein